MSSHLLTLNPEYVCCCHATAILNILCSQNFKILEIKYVMVLAMYNIIHALRKANTLYQRVKIFLIFQQVFLSTFRTWLFQI